MEFNFIGVNFENNQKIYYFKNTLKDLEIGDQIVVETKYGFQLAKVAEIAEKSERTITQWTVTKLDLSDYHARKEQREKEKATKIRMGQLDRKMKTIFEKEVIPALLASYAAEHPEYAALQEEYNQLKKEIN